MAFEGIRPELPPGLREGGVVAIARRVAPDRLEAIGDGLLRGGVRALEVTLNDPEADALAAIRIVARHAEQTELVIGAGTVLSIDAAARALDAGARFLVMPHTDPDLIEWAASRGVPSFPGAMTPTEIVRAWRAKSEGPNSGTRATVPTVRMAPITVAMPGTTADVMKMSRTP